MNAAPVFPVETTGPVSGIVALRDSVAAYFAEYEIPAIVAEVGLKYRTFILNQSNPANAGRVVFIPGQFDGSEAPKARRYGFLSRMSRNHASVSNPRELANWDRDITLSIWSAPVPGDTRNESATIATADALLEQVIRAVHASGLSDIIWGTVLLNTPATENLFGAELLVSIVQHEPIYGVTLDYAQPTASFDSTDVRVT